MNAIRYSPRQLGNPLLKLVRDVPLEQGEKSMKPDFLISEKCGVLFLSMKYNSLHPEYIYKRLETLGKNYELRVLLVVTDVENPTNALSALTKMCVRRDLALVVTWSFEEAAVYLTSLKKKSRASTNPNTTLNIQKKVGSTYEEQLVEVLTKIPRINRPDVLGLSDHYKTLQNIVKNAGKVEQLDGWGPTKSAKFKKAVSEPFTGSNPLGDHDSSNQAQND